MIISCQNCKRNIELQGYTNKSIGKKVYCIYCRKATAIIPSFSEVEKVDLTMPRHQEILNQKPAPNYVEVEVSYVPFWMLLLQGIEIAIVMCVLLWVFYGETPVKKERRAEAYKALIAKEKKDAIFLMPEKSNAVYKK